MDFRSTPHRSGPSPSEDLPRVLFFFFFFSFLLLLFFFFFFFSSSFSTLFFIRQQQKPTVDLGGNQTETTNYSARAVSQISSTASTGNHSNNIRATSSTGKTSTPSQTIKSLGRKIKIRRRADPSYFTNRGVEVQASLGREVVRERRRHTHRLRWRILVC